MFDTDLKSKVSALRAQQQEVSTELERLEAEMQKDALTRIEEIRAEIVSLTNEAEQLSKEANINFYRDTFLAGIDQAGTNHWGHNHYWSSSDYC